MDRAARRAHEREIWQDRAERASDAFGLVLLMVIVTFVIVSLLENRDWEAVLISVATGSTSVVALTSSQSKRRFVRGALWLSALTVLLTVIAAISDVRIFFDVASCVQISLLAVSMVAVLRRVISTAAVNSRTILGALSVYTVLGMLFSFLYGLVDRLQNGPFFEGVAETQGSDFLFFSYTTLTTTGYGNLIPEGQPGEMLSTFEMLIGQIFLVTLVAGLVSLWSPGSALRRHRGGEGGASEPSA
ncbi:MAG: ion channel [Solirubrobacterales bacterium]